MTVDHHVELSPEDRAELERREAEERRQYIRALVGSVKAGEEPVPLPGKTWIRRANDCALTVACLLVVVLFAGGAPSLVSVVGGIAGGFGAGWLFFHAPRISDRIGARLHNRRSRP